MKIHRESIWNRHLGAALAALLAVGIGGLAAQAEEAAGNTKPYVVKIHADWCGTCTKLNPTFEALQEKYGDRATLVVLDVTDKDKQAAATAEAKRLGIEEFYARYKSRTGTIGILLADGETVRVLAGETDLARYDEVIELAIERSAS